MTTGNDLKVSITGYDLLSAMTGTSGYDWCL